jgi:hypothetical protein
VKFSFIAKHRGIWPADWLCGALGVSRGGLSAWLTRASSRRSRSEEEPRGCAPASWRAIAPMAPGGCGTTCWRRGCRVVYTRIERLMRLQALKARPRRRRLPPDLGERQTSAVAANVLDRSFEAHAPNRKWIADFTPACAGAGFTSGPPRVGSTWPRSSICSPGALSNSNTRIYVLIQAPLNQLFYGLLVILPFLRVVQSTGDLSIFHFSVWQARTAAHEQEQARNEYTT